MTVAHSPTPEELMAHLDGELPADVSRGVQAHLAICATCQRVAGELRQVSADMRTWNVEEPPVTLRAEPGGRLGRGSVEREGGGAREPGQRGALAAFRARWSVWRIAHARVFAASAAAVVLVVAALKLSMPPRKQPAEFAETTVDSIAAVTERGIAKPGARPQSAPGVVAGQAGAAGGAAAVPVQPQGAASPRVAGPQVARTVTLRIVASEFDAVRPAVERTLKEAGGFVGQLGATDAGNAPRSIHGTLRVPVARLDGVVASLKTLGRVTNESQQAEDVTEQVVDLDVRISNARITEKRLADLIQNRTGRVSDVLEAEREMARVRTELERLDAQRKNVAQRVAYAMLVLEVFEERRAGVDLGMVPVPSRLRYAIADGFASALTSVLEATLFVLRVGPTLALWVVLLGVPAWLITRRWRVLGPHTRH